MVPVALDDVPVAEQSKIRAVLNMIQGKYRHNLQNLIFMLAYLVSVSEPEFYGCSLGSNYISTTSVVTVLLDQMSFMQVQQWAKRSN